MRPIRSDSDPEMTDRLTITPIVWGLHWVSAILIIFILATSLTSGLGLTRRFFGLDWLPVHLSSGLAILVLAITRVLRTVRSSRRSDSFDLNPGQCVRALERIIQYFLLASSIVVPTMGLLIFQVPPLGKAILVFGLFPWPAFFKLDHQLHLWVILLHLVASVAMVAFVLVHLWFAVRPRPNHHTSPLRMMIWPWA